MPKIAKQSEQAPTGGWEYLHLLGSELDVHGQLNGLGAKGWELIGVIGNYGGIGFQFFFKRALQLALLDHSSPNENVVVQEYKKHFS